MLKIRVLQDWSISLILFILFTILLIKILNEKNKKAKFKIKEYIKDSLLTLIAVSENKAVVKLEKVFTIAKNWVYNNGLSFDLEKFEATHFFKK